jgi:hypothetical protein
LKKILKLWHTFPIVFLLLLTIPLVAAASEDGIDEINVTANLHPDGSADITETWVIDNVNDGTEYYKAIYNADHISISGLTVTDDSGQTYETISDWETSASFAEKAYKCGILTTEDGCELCWGISEMGSRTYQISYHITGLVKSYQDQDGFYYQFISDELSSPPKSAAVTLRMENTPFSAENADIWAFGYDGEIQFENGAIVAKADQSLASDHYINILAGFHSGIFDAQKTEESFENIKENAMNKKENKAKTIIIVLSIIGGIFALAIILIVILNSKIQLADGSQTKRISVGKAPLNNKAPHNLSIPILYSSCHIDASMLTLSLSPIAAYLTKWQLENAVWFESEKKKNGKPGDVTIILNKEPTEDKAGKLLYQIIRQASTDNRLTLAGWQKYLEKNYKQLDKWRIDLKDIGNEALISRGWAAPAKKANVKFTASGYEYYTKILGFYKYLTTLRKGEDRAAAVQSNWEEYIIYASLFQITDSVVKGLEKMDASGFQDFCGHYNLNTFFFLYYMQYINTMSTHASPGTGGGAAFSSGGGGFSGGGGGGSR